MYCLAHLPNRDALVLFILLQREGPGSRASCRVDGIQNFERLQRHGALVSHNYAQGGTLSGIRAVVAVLIHPKSGNFCGESMIGEQT